ncbi:MAG: DUF885 domain-containing protein [Vicinamibacterales bacterium]|nr:DUF885 domain-containing protein [Vicinamibacterales bacterium]
MIASEPLCHFIDDYLSFLHESHPTGATLDGVHQFDDHLEDLGRGALESQAQQLSAFARRLSSMNNESLTAIERIERPWVTGHVQSCLHELEHIRTWERNPQHYAEILAASLATQVLFDYAPAEERARRVLSKLRQTPRLMQAARDNVKEPPGIFVKSSLDAMKGTLRFVEVDLPKAFMDVDDLGLLGDLADAQTEAIDAIKSYITHLDTELAPKARASFRLGPEKFAKKVRLDDGLDVTVEKLLDIGLREMNRLQEEFRKAAGRVEPGDPVEVWKRVKERQFAPGGIVETATHQVQELAEFLRRRDLVTVPTGERVIVAPTPEFCRWTFASMWTPGPFETRLSQAYYYVTDADPAWAPERQQDHLRDLNEPRLWSVSIHEAYPGHFLHFQHLRQVESKARRSLMLASVATIEGWAHYAEQMMIDAGFGKGDPTIKLAQLAESLVRLARLIVAIRLHAEDMSVEQGVRFFRDEAFLEEGSARREAERGTFDPGYGAYAAGKLMLLKLREDYKGEQGEKYSLKTFHDTFMRNGVATISVHRQLMLKDTRGAVIE